MLIVGFCGYSRCGKDTASQLLLNNSKIPLTKEKFAFADALRDLARVLNVYFPEIGIRYNDVIEQYGYETAKTKFPCVRDHLVALGHGARSCIHPSVWIEALEYKITQSNPEIVIISDVRYLNEVNFILNHGGLVIYLKRNNLGPVNDTEASSIKEILTTNTIRIIDNNADLNILEAHVLQIVQDYLESSGTTLIP
jgi:hypothetical protein